MWTRNLENGRRRASFESISWRWMTCAARYSFVRVVMAMLRKPDVAEDYWTVMYSYYLYRTSYARRYSRAKRQRTVRTNTTADENK